MDHENCGLPLLTVVVVDVVVFVIELELTTTGLFKSLAAECHLDADVVVDAELVICVADEVADLEGELPAPPGGAGAIRIGLCLDWVWPPAPPPVVVDITFDEVLLRPAIKS